MSVRFGEGKPTAASPNPWIRSPLLAVRQLPLSGKTQNPRACTEEFRGFTATLLEFLRCGGETSELLPEQTVRKPCSGRRERFDRLSKVADTEPPRVRALLGAIGELGKKPSALQRLHNWVAGASALASS